MARMLDPDTFLQLSPQGVVVDVRTPAEFASGHIPGAVNLPLFSNEQRAEVGTIYTRVGRDQAVLRGLEFVGSRLVEIVTRAKEISQGREIFLHCWRGGMRSGSVAWLLETAGLKVSLLQGGYKAYRHSFNELLERHKWQFIILGGKTGSGKTELLEHLAGMGEQVLDLEGLANHKGSAFGGLGRGGQPTTEHFINLLHNAFRGFDPGRRIWCENESMLVGHVFIPKELFDLIHTTGRLIEVVMPVEQRLDRLVGEYGCFSQEELAAAFTRIGKRLGWDKLAEAQKALEAGDMRTAAALALGYYDKAYSTGGGTVVDLDNADMRGCAEKLLKL